MSLRAMAHALAPLLLALGVAACKAPDGDCRDGDCAGDDDDEGDGDDDTGTPTDDDLPGNSVSLDRYPPVVVRTVPTSGASNVDPALDRIEVVFSRPMGDGWSWVSWEGFPFPDLGDVWFETPTLHVGDVTVDPESAYLVWFNSSAGIYENFTDTAGLPALAFPLGFRTGPTEDPDGLFGFPPAVVATDPAPGTDGVDPALDRVTVTFSRDMDPDGFGWGLDAPRTFPETRGERFDDPRTAVLEVVLEPATTYAIWINEWTDGFAATDGTPAATYLVTFRTADQ